MNSAYEHVRGCGCEMPASSSQAAGGHLNIRFGHLNVPLYSYSFAIMARSVKLYNCDIKCYSCLPHKSMLFHRIKIKFTFPTQLYIIQHHHTIFCPQKINSLGSESRNADKTYRIQVDLPFTECLASFLKFLQVPAQSDWPFERYTSFNVVSKSQKSLFLRFYTKNNVEVYSSAISLSIALKLVS